MQKKNLLTGILNLFKRSETPKRDIQFGPTGDEARQQYSNTFDQSMALIDEMRNYSMFDEAKDTLRLAEEAVELKKPTFTLSDQGLKDLRSNALAQYITKTDFLKMDSPDYIPRGKYRDRYVKQLESAFKDIAPNENITEFLDLVRKWQTNTIGSAELAKKFPTLMEAGGARGLGFRSVGEALQEDLFMGELSLIGALKGMGATESKNITSGVKVVTPDQKVLKKASNLDKFIDEAVKGTEFTPRQIKEAIVKDYNDAYLADDPKRISINDDDAIERLVDINTNYGKSDRQNYIEDVLEAAFEINIKKGAKTDPAEELKRLEGLQALQDLDIKGRKPNAAGGRIAKHEGGILDSIGTQPQQPVPISVRPSPGINISGIRPPKASDQPNAADAISTGPTVDQFGQITQRLDKIEGILQTQQPGLQPVPRGGFPQIGTDRPPMAAHMGPRFGMFDPFLEAKQMVDFSLSRVPKKERPAVMPAISPFGPTNMMESPAEINPKQVVNMEDTYKLMEDEIPSATNLGGLGAIGQQILSGSFSPFANQGQLRAGYRQGGRVGMDEGGNVMMAMSDSSMEDADEHSYRLFNKPYVELTPDELKEFEEEMMRLRSKFLATGGRVRANKGIFASEVIMKFLKRFGMDAPDKVADKKQIENVIRDSDTDLERIYKDTASSKATPKNQPTIDEIRDMIQNDPRYDKLTAKQMDEVVKRETVRADFAYNMGIKPEEVDDQIVDMLIMEGYGRRFGFANGGGVGTLFKRKVA